MKIAVLSDIHDNLLNLKKVLGRIKKENCKAIIFCGDYCAPIIFKTLAASSLPLYAVFGNVDGAQYEIMRVIQENKYQLKQEKDICEMELGGKKIAVCHKPEFAEGLATTGKYDAVFYGHTHKAGQKRTDKTLLANPGEVHNLLGKPSFGIYDTESNTFEIIES